MERERGYLNLYYFTIKPVCFCFLCIIFEVLKSSIFKKSRNIITSLLCKILTFAQNKIKQNDFHLALYFKQYKILNNNNRNNNNERKQ